MDFLPDSTRAAQASTDELRKAFLVEGLFQPGEVNLRHFDLDRVVLGGAVPVERPLPLTAPVWLAATYFTERRELGVLNIGGPGSVTVDGRRHVVAARDVVYVGRGSREIIFASDAAATPARFYLVSYPAHAAHPTACIAKGDVEATELGAVENANKRRLAKYVHPGGPASAQLVMGVTEMAGGVWNTMPPHTHHRRSETYLYFGLDPDAIVVHLMGEPHETRHLIVRDGDVVLSPSWSIHAGCGTGPYGFCWAMGGENQDFTDMQGVDMRELK
jgi:4-deoxy-L-threo-5-hexosulose-uronate ketol-isomerase